MPQEAPHALTIDSIRAEVAEMLGVADPATIAEDESLADRGLDSIRLMTLTERWRAAGADVGFLDLAETPTLGAWWERLRA